MAYVTGIGDTAAMDAVKEAKRVELATKIAEKKEQARLRAAEKQVLAEQRQSTGSAPEPW